MAEPQEKFTLSSEDWDLLLPGTEYPIGKSKIMLKPLGLESLSNVLEALHKLIDDWKDVLTDTSAGKANQKAMTVTEQILLYFPKVTSLIQVHGIHIISDMSGLHEDDVKRLPPNIAVELFDKCLELNIKSQEGLEKNLTALADQVTTLLTSKGKAEPPKPLEK